MKPYGPDGLLIECEDTAHAIAVRHALDLNGGWRTVQSGVDTIVVQFDDNIEFARQRATEAITNASRTNPAGRHHTIEVTYTGDDLQTVADRTNMTVAEVIAAHTGCEYTVAAVGFAPGFGYLIGGDPRLNLPRLDTPRTRVPAGAVGVAGPLSCIYPTTSPGGWNLLGHTNAVMFDPTNTTSPSLLRAGDTLQFKATS